MPHRGTLPASGYALLSLREVSAGITPFGERKGRVGGALGTAIATHAIIGLALWGVARVQPIVQRSSPEAAAPSIAPFVFMGRTGDGAGRSGGGNRSPDPVPLLRTRGADAMAVPVGAPRSLATPDTIAHERDSTLALPVKPMDAGELPQVGALDGVPGPPTDARGPGDGGVGSRPGSDRGLGDRPGDGIGEGPYGVGNGVTSPELIYRTQPQYTPEAMRAKRQGVATLTGIVGVDGTLHDIRVARSLDGTFGLDQEAITCVRQWRFRPGTRQGKPVAVYVTIEVAFNLR